MNLSKDTQDVFSNIIHRIDVQSPHIKVVYVALSPQRFESLNRSGLLRTLSLYAKNNRSLFLCRPQTQEELHAHKTQAN